MTDTSSPPEADLRARVAELEAEVERLRAAVHERFREQWRADVGNPFFEAARAAADERIAALKHEARANLTRAEAAEAEIERLRAALGPFSALAKVYPRPRIGVDPADTVIFSHQETAITLADLDRVVMHETEQEDPPQRPREEG